MHDDPPRNECSSFLDLHGMAYYERILHHAYAFQRLRHR